MALTKDSPILITGALIGNYLDIYRVFLARRSRRQLADVGMILAALVLLNL